ncbi:hypothetical protein J9303_04760 [Bacillaceae bacterium Marseille-Q3522]|nr:hypothetical protein [Bacillaceae bacterium Marseille-Q3522]
MNFSPLKMEKVKHVGFFGISVKKKYYNKGIGKKLITVFIK